MKLFKFLTVGVVVSALMVLLGTTLAGAVHESGHMGATVLEGGTCGIGGGVDRAGDALSGAVTTDSHTVKNKTGKVVLKCLGNLPAASHFPETAVKQVGNTSFLLPINGNEVADARACGTPFGGTQNWTQTIDTDGSVTLDCRLP